ncbi:MAG: hypothetical protein AAFV45_15170 [Pseudomonadota bacterium]
MAEVNTTSAGNEVAHNDLAMPRAVRMVVWSVVALAVSGGLYLIAVRGEALLLDLGKLAAMCF